jgi:hypothetical protein
MAESTKASGGSSGKQGAGMTGTKESGLSGRSYPTPDEDTFDPAFDGPNSTDWRTAEEKLQADDDARRDRVREEEREAREAADEHWRNIDRDVKRPEDFLPEDKIRVAETDAERYEQEHSNDDRSKSGKSDGA